MEGTTEPSEPQADATPGWLRAVGILLGVHVEHAQREARSDALRLLGALVWAVLAAIFVALALFAGHAALVVELYREYGFALSDSLAVVAVADLLLCVVCVLFFRARAKRPILVQTRSLVRRTVSSLTDP